MTQDNKPTTTQKTTILEVLNNTRPAAIAENALVAGRFKDLYTTFHGKESEKYYQAEKFHFAKIVSESGALQGCTPVSLYGAFMDLCVHGLSLDPQLKQTYLVPKKGKAVLMVTAYGELAIRKREGQIRGADNPVLVFKGEHFVHGTTMKGERFIEHRSEITEEQTSEAVACYVRLIKADGSIDYGIMTRAELEDLRRQSDNPGGPSWTRNYNGMFKNKTIKHAFKGYERPRSLGRAQFSELETESEKVEDALVDVYGLDETANPAPETRPDPQPSRAVVDSVSPAPSREASHKPAPAASIPFPEDEL